MKVRKYKKRRKNKTNLPALFAGLLLVGVMFVFSLSVLSDSNGPQLGNQKQQEKVSKEEFIERIAPYSQELQSSYGVLSSIIIGQAILESNWGQSTLAEKYNNLFGIKAYGDQRKVNLETKEYINEVWVTIQGDFKVYDTWEESMDDHTRLFIDGVTWNPQLYEKVLLATDYIEAANALQEAGYATDPTYAAKVIGVIESHKLYEYDH